MIKAMIVEDKTAAIEMLRWQIKEYCPEITQVVSAMSVDEALPLLHDFKPDILFWIYRCRNKQGLIYWQGCGNGILK
jgi:DNA-binding LytR/AlgR family response regulator